MNPTPTPSTIFSTPPIINIVNSVVSTPFTFTTFLFILKIFVLIAFSLYLVFAVVIIRQISLMNKTIKTSFSPALKISGYIHLAISIMAWLIAFTVL